MIDVKSSYLNMHTGAIHISLEIDGEKLQILGNHSHRAEEPKAEKQKAEEPKATHHDALGTPLAPQDEVIVMTHKLSGQPLKVVKLEEKAVGVRDPYSSSIIWFMPQSVYKIAPRKVFVSADGVQLKIGDKVWVGDSYDQRKGVVTGFNGVTVTVKIDETSVSVLADQLVTRV